MPDEELTDLEKGFRREIDEILGSEEKQRENQEVLEEEKPKSFLEEVFEKARKVNGIVFFKKGEVIKCKVIEVRGDIYGNIFPRPTDDPKRLEIWEKKWNKFVWLVLVECPQYGIRIVDVITFSYHPNSRYSRLRKCYKRIAPGSEVFIGEEQGKIKIVCPEE